MTQRPKDHFYKQAKAEGYLARSAYKLEQLDVKYRLFQKKQKGTLIDFGASPGSWYQYYQPLLHPETFVVAIDQKPFKTPLAHGMFLDRDILELSAEELRPYIHGPVAWVLSDALHNMTGNRVQDQARADALRSHISELALALLAPGGCVVIKTYETPQLQPWIKSLQGKFKTARLEKPEASRKQSPEMFFVGIEYRA